MKWLPDAKVWAGGIGGVLAWALLAGVNAAFHFDLAGLIQPYIDSLFTALCAANAQSPCPLPSAQVLLAVLFGQGMAYSMPATEWDKIKRLTNDLVEKAQNNPNVPVTPPPAK